MLLSALALGSCEHAAPLGFACPGPSLSCATFDGIDSGSGPVAQSRNAADSGNPTIGRPLRVTIFSANGQPLDRAQLPCDQPCIEVKADAQGGEPPYTYRWSDGNDMQTRTLCPVGPSRHTVEVHDSSKPEPGEAVVTTVLDLDRASCAADAGSRTASTVCQRFAVGEYRACGNVGTGADLPQLKTGQRYTLSAHGDLTSAGSLQVVGVGLRCTGSESLATLSLPQGPSTVSVCLAPSVDTGALMLTITSGGSAAFLTNADSFVEVCSGCD
jgi:hypothetical protein